MNKQEAKTKNTNIDIAENKTVIIEGIGKASDVGELDIKKFINVAMNLKSFWR
ncbi:hypothetical protein [Bacillus sp. HMF5848]|uniref:hypothetical protein n=1 Tax=Bacillus sp. HMF5848 TaxID=2495421 RepID=UPI00163B540C|nr:hypothetical protein [Bacillus sp. HMF5848]